MASMVIYFSRADENYFGGAYRYIEKGNTEVVAEMIAAATGAPLFKVEPAAPYAADYKTCIAEAKKLKQENARPPIKALPDVSAVDTIYLGYPNYWGTMPMQMFTLLSGIPTAGKTIKPFCTHEGSGLGGSERDIQKLCPRAKVERGLAVNGSGASGARDAVEKWA